RKDHKNGASIEEIIENGCPASIRENIGVTSDARKEGAEHEKAGPAKVGIQARINRASAQNIFCIAGVPIDNSEARGLFDKNLCAIEDQNKDQQVKDNDKR